MGTIYYNTYLFTYIIIPIVYYKKKVASTNIPIYVVLHLHLILLLLLHLCIEMFYTLSDIIIGAEHTHHQIVLCMCFYFKFNFQWNVCVYINMVVCVCVSVEEDVRRIPVEWDKVFYLCGGFVVIYFKFYPIYTNTMLHSYGNLEYIRIQFRIKWG